MTLISDPERHRRRLIWVTERELKLINLIRDDKGLGPVLVHQRRESTLS